MFPKEFDYKTASIDENIEETSIFRNTKSLCPQYSDNELKFITSYLGLALNIALTDGKIYKSEVDYICTTLPSNIKLNQNEKEKLVLLNMSDMFSQRNYSSTTPYFCQYIARTFSDQQIDDFVQLIITLALVDGDFHVLEKSLAKTYLNRLGIKKETLAKIKPTAKRIADEFKRDLEDEHYSFVKNLSRAPSMAENTLPNKFDTKKYGFLILKLENTPLFSFLNKRFTDLSTKDRAFVSSFLGFAFSILFIDKEVHEKEVAYIRDMTSKIFVCPDTTLDHLMDFCLFLGEKEKFRDDHLETYIDVLNNSTDKETKKELLNIFVNLCQADKKILPSENALLSMIIQKFEMSSEELIPVVQKAQGVDGCFQIIHSGSTWAQDY